MPGFLSSPQAEKYFLFIFSTLLFILSFTSILSRIFIRKGKQNDPGISQLPTWVLIADAVCVFGGGGSSLK